MIRNVTEINPIVDIPVCQSTHSHYNCKAQTVNINSPQIGMTQMNEHIISKLLY